MNVRTLCLAILNMHSATGYEIKKLCIDGSFQHFVEVSFGSIYPALAKLETDGLVSCHTEAQDGKPDRKIYTISDRGRSQFVKLINVLPNPDKFKSEFLLLSLNADLASRELLEQAISAKISQCEAELEMMNEVLDGCDHLAKVWTANYGRATLEAKMEYLKKNRGQLLDLACDSATSQAAE